MSNTFTYDILKDSTKDVFIKLTGNFTSSNNESNNNRISANSFLGALNSYGFDISNGGIPLNYYGFTIKNVWHSINNNLTVELFYNGSNNNPILILNNSGEYRISKYSTPLSNYEFNTNGNIGIKTFGASNNSSYTLILEIHKNNNYYDSGKLNNNQDFNNFPNLEDIVKTENNVVINTESNDIMEIPIYK